MPSQPSKATAKRAIRKLTQQSPTAKNINDILEETVKEHNDRGAAVIGASIVEWALEQILVVQFRPLSSDDYARLFQGDSGPLSTLSAKTKLAYALGSCSKEERNEIDCIRDIRNAFAHALVPLSFKTKEVADMCNLLKFEPPPEMAVKSKKKYIPAKQSGPRWQFISSTIELIRRLIGEDGIYNQKELARALKIWR